MIRLAIYNWWDAYRLCCCVHQRFAHQHYRGAVNVMVAECSLCPCERFQWRILKWVY